jgi:glycerol kinase
MVANDWLLQRLSDILNVSVERPQVIETTALGAASLAGAKAGVIDGKNGIREIWQADKLFEPQMSASERERRYAGWLDAVGRVRTSN